MSKSQIFNIQRQKDIKVHESNLKRRSAKKSKLRLNKNINKGVIGKRISPPMKSSIQKSDQWSKVSLKFRKNNLKTWSSNQTSPMNQQRFSHTDIQPLSIQENQQSFPNIRLNRPRQIPSVENQKILNKTVERKLILSRNFSRPKNIEPWESEDPDLNILDIQLTNYDNQYLNKMGANCTFCLKDGQSSNKELAINKEASGKPRYHENQNESLMDQSDIINLQSTLKSYADKSVVKTVKDSRMSENYLKGSSRASIEPQSQRIDLDEIKGNLPDYSTPVTRQAEQKHGMFTYDEDFDDGIERQERGPIELDNNAIYTGDWNNAHERHGKGMQVWNDGSKYEGYWRHDKANGKGRLIHADGDVYLGNWVEDKACGFGVYIHIDGARYEGQWEDDKQHGSGVETWPDGARYEGGYKLGKKHGTGRFQWADGSVYEGDFRDNHINGYGTYKWSDKRVYTGDWKDNRMHGKGTFVWPDGRSYTGDYEFDKKQGFGIFKWPDGRKYEGRWWNGKQHGKGMYYTAQG